jgi:hypothetical protein
MAAGTVTITEGAHGASVKKIVFAWVSGNAGQSGTASGTTTKDYDGEIIGLTTIPGAAALAPDDNYDITITDAGGHDVLIGAGMNRDTANTEHVARASLAGVSASLLTINVAAAGDDNAGTCIIYVR